MSDKLESAAIKQYRAEAGQITIRLLARFRNDVLELYSVEYCVCDNPDKIETVRKTDAFWPADYGSAANCFADYVRAVL